MRIRIALIAAFIGLLGGAVPARPCSCLEVGSGSASVDSADAIFLADVVSLKLLEERCSSCKEDEFTLRVKATLRVWEAWKGVEDDFVTVTTGMGGGDCGYAPKLAIGERFVFFVDKDEKGGLEVSICSFTTPESEASELLRNIGPAKKHFQHRPREGY